MYAIQYIHTIYMFVNMYMSATLPIRHIHKTRFLVRRHVTKHEMRGRDRMP